jgi:hypothetical protein
MMLMVAALIVKRRDAKAFGRSHVTTMFGVNQFHNSNMFVISSRSNKLHIQEARQPFQ